MEGSSAMLHLENGHQKSLTCHSGHKLNLGTSIPMDKHPKASAHLAVYGVCCKSLVSLLQTRTNGVCPCF